MRVANHRSFVRTVRVAVVMMVAAVATLVSGAADGIAAASSAPSQATEQSHAADSGVEHAHTDLAGVSMDELERGANPAVGLRPKSGPAAREAAAALAAGPEVSGSWGPVVPAAVVPVFTALLPNGKVLMWDSVGDNATESYPDQSFTRAAVWDPATGVSTRIDVEGANIFCAGFVQLSDGRVFVAGGNKDQSLNGIKLTHIFDWETLSWTRGPDMTGERWYPSVAALMDGQALVAAGGPTFAEIRGADGSIRTLPGITDPSSRVYPFLQSSQDGRVLLSGTANGIRRLDVTGAGSMEAAAARDGIDRSYGSYANYEPGLTLVSGGGSTTVNGAAVPHSSNVIVDVRGGSMATRAAAPMANRRRQHNLTILADGSLLATGGQSVTGDGLISLGNAVYAAERYVPATDSWSTLSSAAVVRQYHSTAMLLPDGRVMTGGGGICGSCQAQGYLRKDIEVFSPPYLFAKDGSGALAPRPVVASAPTQITLDQSFQVTSPDAARVAKVGLIRLGAPTHSEDQGQRYLPLSFTRAGDVLTLAAPPNPAEAPPGYYMLFVVDIDGVPAVAPILSAVAPAPGSFQGAGIRSGSPAAIVYTGLNGSGVAQQLEPGTWRATRGSLAQVGNDQASSIDIARGWSATVCADDAMTTCTTLLPGAPTSLPAGFDNAISAVRLQPFNGETEPPTVAVTSPTAGATVAGAVTVAASAADNVGVQSVQFLLDGAALGAPDTAAPYETVWNTTTAANGQHTLAATARDTAGNSTTAANVAVQVQNSAPAPAGLVGAWGFNAGSGTTAADSSGQGNNGVVNGATWTTGGRYGGGLVFDGVNDRVDVANTASLALSGGMTIEAWVNPTTTTGWCSVVVKERPKGRAYSLYASNAASRPSSYLRLKSDVSIAGPSALPIGVWSHLVTTFDGTTHRLYVNGTQVAAVASSGKLSQSGQPLRFGGNTVFSEWFSGTLDEIRIYNRALTPAEIGGDMTRPLP